MDKFNLRKAENHVKLRKLTNPLAFCIIALLIISITLVFATTAVHFGTTTATYLTGNAVWLEDNPNWLGLYVLSPSTMTTTVNTLAQNHIKYVFLNVGSNDFWNNEGSLDIQFEETNATYKQFVSMCHEKGIEVLVWLESYQDLDYTPQNWINLLTTYNNIMAAGNFDGINSDIEQGFSSQNGTYQNYIDFNNNMTIFMHQENKLWMPDIGFDWQGIYNGYLHVDAIVSMFYSDVSTFENSQSISFWKDEFNPTPTSPIILGIFCHDQNTHSDSWQFTTCANYINSYPPTNLIGISLWMYETVTTRNSWSAFDNLISQVTTTPIQAPRATSAPIQTSIGITGFKVVNGYKVVLLLMFL